LEAAAVVQSDQPEAEHVMLDQELKRYIEYLQRQCMNPDYADGFDSAKVTEWIKSNPPALQRLYDRHLGGDAAAIDKYVREATGYTPTFAHDTFHSTAVFTQVLLKVQAACSTPNVSPRNSVVLSSSTEIGLTPLARPSSSGDHVLFVGPGKMAFCDYWAKAYAAMLKRFSLQCHPVTLDRADLFSLAKLFPEPLLLIGRLLLHYAFCGTFINFGEVTVPDENIALRMELLQSMEIFAIGHEVGHFVWEERRPNQSSSPDAEESHATEYFCDQYGQAVSRWHGVAENNWSCFVTSGAILYLHSGSLSQRLFSKYRGDSGDDAESESHPRTCDRINRAVENAVACVAADQAEVVRNYLNEIVAVVRFVENEVFPIVAGAIDQARSSGQGPSS
jgi:hypothetical protein